MENYILSEQHKHNSNTYPSHFMFYYWNIETKKRKYNKIVDDLIPKMSLEIVLQSNGKYGIFDFVANDFHGRNYDTLNDAILNSSRIFDN